MIIHLLRHTKPDIDSGICYGITNLGLDPTTAEFDIITAADLVQHKSLKTIYSSPLKRCLQLATAITEMRDKNETVSIDLRVRELDFGDWEMMKWDDIFLRPQSKEWFENYIEAKTPNGESFREMIERATSFFNEIKNQSSDEILVVTHSGFIRAALVATEKLTPLEAFDLKIEYGELITFEI